ncbi:hypothetical protein [Arsenicicoccus dermatophilus]|nr:hypothetical protein [Arsenicicoccus dermatophilus]MCH8614480.1 hypothetical protein [Arsenicicoccus dermatophilus]
MTRDRDMVSHAAECAIFGVDNVSRLDADQQDFACQIVTGATVVQRQLYTNAGTSLRRVRRPVILNGVELGKMRKDLVSRLLPIRRDPLDDAAKSTPDVMTRQIDELLPAARAELLDMLVVVLDGLEHHGGQPTRATPSRMVAWVAVLDVLDAAYGWNTRAAYEAGLGQEFDRAVEGDPLASAFLQLTETPSWPGMWTGSAKDLLDLLGPYAPEDAGGRYSSWPSSYNQVPSAVGRIAGTLRRYGITVTEPTGQSTVDGRRIRAWRISTPTTTETTPAGP